MVKLVRRRRAMRKRPAGRRMKKRGVGRAGAKRSSDYAKVVEIVEAPLLAQADGTGENTGSLLNFRLADYQRPQEVAHAYKYYRLSKVEISWIPYFNVAQAQGAIVSRVPQLYTTIDRLSNRYMIPTESEMLSRGVSPKMFTGIKRLSFKPNLLQELSLETYQSRDGTGALDGISNAGFLNATALFDKWLPTQQSFGYNEASISPPNQTGQQIAPIGVNPYALVYHGVAFVASIEGQAPETSAIIGDVQYKCTWEFKGPRALVAQRPSAEPNPYVATSSQTNAGTPAPNTQPTTYP